MTWRSRPPLLTLCDRQKLLCYYRLAIGAKIVADGYWRVPKTTLAAQEKDKAIADSTDPGQPIDTNRLRCARAADKQECSTLNRIYYLLTRVVSCLSTFCTIGSILTVSQAPISDPSRLPGVKPWT